MAEQLKSFSLWWEGPTWLSSFGPLQEKIQFETKEDIKISKQCQAATLVSDNTINELLTRTSCLARTTRVIAWMLRLRPRRQQKPTYLTTSELHAARNIIIKYQQEIDFSDEIKKLKNNQNLSSKSRILSLKPFLDQDGMLRVGGRITKANISWERKHPLIIAHSGHLTNLLIDQAHKKTFHGGARLTLAYLRQDYWIIGGNRATKKQIRLCITCRRHKPERPIQIMGDLPESRSNPSRPFLNTGVDFTGFVNVKANKGRGIKTTRGYIAVFVCMATKAADLSSASFIAALRRMAARRGTPQHIFSDNGTNFVGANKILQEEFNIIKSSLDQHFYNTISDMNLTWHFNAPSWPSAGRLWEAAVKSLKHHLRRVLGDQHLTFEEFSTLLAQIEGCLNAHPLCALSEDPEDIDYLTPSHFLSSGPTLSIVESEKDERTRWKLTQKIFHDIWKRWQSEYLCQLQSRSKWTLSKPNIKVGDVVIIHEPNLPAGKWAMGRVTEVHPGNDGFVRVVSLKTKNGIMKRPITKLSILPVSENLEENRSEDNEVLKVPKKSSSKKINITSMAVMLLMLIITPVQCAHNISYFNNNQRIYFDKISNMKLARDEWKLIVYYDIELYWQGITLFSKYINH
ncbi:uncharacterized protein LOC121738265 [Aricia agestis]|uniref:uncharacterized protein LOC121738265 n=1 Tax=Aricia agestis TaxID=91739 RepID=UPI001C203694|nr:uncharacterized protein LOC121738265 [Aricia agestis]